MSAGADFSTVLKIQQPLGKVKGKIKGRRRFLLAGGRCSS
jgi:hypothetical protein